MNSWLPIIGPILALVSAVAVALIVARRGREADRIVEQAGIATDKTNSIGQVIAGQNSLIASLQADNKDQRVEIALVREEVKALRLRVDLVESGNLDLVKKNLALEAENLVLHAENEDFKVQLAEQAKKIAEQATTIAEMQITIDELRR